MAKRKRRQREHVDFGKGAFAGYQEFRHGSPRPVTLPRIYTTKKRGHVVDTLFDEMRDWRLTPFEGEGEMIFSVRSNLCLEGHGFARSDIEARSLVGEVLGKMGAERPSWEQGQPGYADPRDTCARCGKDMECDGGTKAYRFCSEVCAKAAVERQVFERKNDRDRLYAAAQRVIRKTRTRPRSCGWCGETFHPVREASRQECCSFSCSAKLKRSRQPVPVRSLECRFCGTEFETIARNAAFCSRACTQVHTKMADGIFPRQMTSRVFDRFLTREIEQRSRYLSASRFDHLVRQTGARITTDWRAAA